MKAKLEKIKRGAKKKGMQASAAGSSLNQSKNSFSFWVKIKKRSENSNSDGGSEATGMKGFVRAHYERDC